ncbi:hypothetical protein NQ317_016374 [Molorchus minor]|uniref:Group XV phospholipase A2 n=1 Tax=Molorchus minor TaxID=1323400 RepID=A0ABQ9IRB0_9CUCU|nr:hypothetical protein NQ317_016374 [Molorchus minor]
MKCSLKIIFIFTFGGQTSNLVILIPGDGGSQLEAKLNKTSVIHYICEKKTNDYFNVWLNMELLVPLVIDFWIDNIKLVYNNVTRRTNNSPVPGFGNSDTVEWLDPSHASTGAYFKDISNSLLSLGLVKNISIRGAPYDFRKDQVYFVQLKQLVEDTYNENKQTSVILLAHSMGGPMSLYFLNQQKPILGKTNILKVYGVWGGSVKAIKATTWVLMFCEKVLWRQEQITCPSLAWLLPSRLFWKPDEVLVQTEKKNYTINDLQEFFKYIFPRWLGNERIQSHISLILNHLELKFIVYMVLMSKTIENLVPGVDGYPTLLYGDGDGTVNRRSLEGCKYWQKAQKQKVYIKELQQVDHLQILSNKTTISYITNLLKVFISKTDTIIRKIRE